MQLKKRILIVSSEVWRDEISGGNVLTNLFSGFMYEYEFAQVYTNSQLPSNLVCKSYFHLAEGEMFGSLKRRSPFGKSLFFENFPKNDPECQKSEDITSRGFFSFARKLRWEIMQTIRYAFWRYSKWETPALKKFIVDFNPDFVFAPMYYDLHVLRLDRYISRLTGKRLIAYVYDDHLSLKQFSLSPFYWINRVILHFAVIRTAKYYGLLYSMTQEQIDEYEPILKVPMKLLKKGGDFYKIDPKLEKLNDPLRIIFGGNLFYKRDAVLQKVVRAIQKINIDKVKIQLFVYTQAPLTAELKDMLHDGRSSFLMGKVSNEELMKIYSKSDIALHVESMGLKQRLITRLSFSTKIIDLMTAGRCLVAICWAKSAPFRYLQAEDAAICISDPDKIQMQIQQLVDNPELIREYGIKSWKCGKKNHDIQQITEELKKDFKAFNSPSNIVVL